MNLLQSQDTLRSLPIQVLRAKSQGQEPPNPDAPLWLVNSVLAEKVAAVEKEKLAQGAAKGSQPSIAEQINQKAGLMALQGQKQQQAQQQMTQQMAQAPQPAPAGVPQPEPQPQPEPPMMAHGGLARLPVDSRMFDYREGGIIGFAEPEGPVPKADPGENLDAVKAQAEQAIARLRSYGTNQQRQDPEGYQQALAAVEAAKQAIQQAQTSYQASMSASGMDKPYIAPQKPFRNPAPVAAPVQNQVTDAYSKPRETSADVAQQGLRSLQTASPAPAAPPAAAPRPRVAPQPPAATPPAATPPAASPAAAPPGATGLPSVASQSELQKMLMENLKKVAPDRTVDEARAEYKAASPAILNEPAGLAQLARLKQQQEQYEEGKKNRPMENFMRGLASASRGGIGGFGDAYLETSEGNRAADAAQADYQNKVMTAVEAMRRGEATTEQTTLLSDLKDARKTKAEADRTRSTNITTAEGNESQRRTQLEVNRLNRESQEKIAELDRAMRQAHYLNPIAAPTEKERFIKEFMKTGLSYTAALSKVMEVLGEPKSTIAGNKIDAATQAKLADNPRYVQALRDLNDPNKSADAKSKAELTIKTILQANNITPESSQPTMTPTQAAAMAKYGAK